MRVMSDSMPSRRRVLQWFAGAAAFATGVVPGEAVEQRVGRLIAEARGLPDVAQRVDFIAAALRGTRYRGYTLMGGPRRAEKLVARDDAFDCVTFCETVLAAAIAKDTDGFEPALRAIRYHNGVVAWRERNHYFFEWGQHNVENKTCRWVAMDGEIDIQKTVTAERGLGRRRFPMTVIPREILLANRGQVASGDIIGFVTRRKNLDYFHVGFVAHDKGELFLRHASQTRRRVVDEKLATFMARYGVRYVTLLRPREADA
jgi:N-acetylmuramoyl-L-alanine amidase-like protein